MDGIMIEHKLSVCMICIHDSAYLYKSILGIYVSKFLKLTLVRYKSLFQEIGISSYYTRTYTPVIVYCIKVNAAFPQWKLANGGHMLYILP